MGLGLGIGLNDIAMRGGAAFPSLNLDSNNGSLEDQPFVNLSRSSEQTYFDSNGILQTAPANTLPPSYEYNPYFDRWERKGWYIGEARENLFTNSEDFSTGWTAQRSVIDTVNATEAPDGTITADFWRENTETGAKYIIQHVLTVGNVYSTSFFVKPNGRTKVGIAEAGSANIVQFDLSSGTVISGDGKITELNNGWYRIAKLNGTAEYTSVGLTLLNDNGDINYTGDGTSGVYIWGAQVEQASFPSPYIPTSGSTVTRSATLADITDLSWYNQDEGTFVVEFEYSDINEQAFDYILGVSDATTNNFYGLRIDGNSNIEIISNNVSTSEVVTDVSSLNQGISKITLSYKDDFKISYNGSSVITSANTPISIASEVFIGQLNNNLLADGHIKSLKYYPKRLSNSQLQSLTNPSLEASLILEA